MKVNLNFKQKLFFYLFLIFIAFTLFVLIFQSVRERQFRRSQLENTLDNITVIINNVVNKNQLIETLDFSTLDDLVLILPQPLVRITIIDSAGVVLYDNEFKEVAFMENHLSRPEIQESLSSASGSNIRTSTTTKEVYYYYAKKYQNYFIRTALVYDKSLINYLKADRLFIFFILSLFLIMLVASIVVTQNFVKTIDKLKNFVISLKNGEQIEQNIHFPDSEFGMISKNIIGVYNELKKTKDKITLEKEKLNNHLYALNEGVAFFSAEKEKQLANNFFIQFLNIISDRSNITAEMIFESKTFQPVINFINVNTKKKKIITNNQLPQFDYSIHKNGQYFNVKSIVFPDKSFEIIIVDTTGLTKRQLMKQQMTSNISHELKTPVAAIMGFLETLQKNSLDKETQHNFIEKALKQANRLKELIDDIQVLNKIDEAIGKFNMESIILKEIIDEVSESLRFRLDESNIELIYDIDTSILVGGNRSLLFSIFHNLIDNSINYAGENISITITKYSEDNNFYYFSLSDTGPGIPEEHLSRIFERFYRLDSGRSRKTGGTGLGLAIVKNAISLHQGSISVRNAKEGGLKFLFTLNRGYSQLAIKY